MQSVVKQSLKITFSLKLLQTSSKLTELCSGSSISILISLARVTSVR